MRWLFADVRPAVYCRNCENQGRLVVWSFGRFSRAVRDFATLNGEVQAVRFKVDPGFCVSSGMAIQGVFSE